MTIFLHTLSWPLLLAGAAFCLIGGIGLLRLPDFYSRIHAAGITDTLGAALILIGLALQAEELLVVIKLALVLAFLFFSSPACTHALGRAAFSHGLRPLLRDQCFDASLASDDVHWVNAEPEEEPTSAS